MHPVLVEVGGFPIHAYGALGAAAFVLGAGLVLLRARALGLDVNRVADAMVWMTLASLAGARLVYVLQHPDPVRSVWSFFDLRGGGLVFYGALLTGLPVGFLILRRYGIPAFAFWDILATAAPLSHAVSRVGCFLAGCCFGTPTTAPWSVVYPEGTPLVPAGIPVHPVQLYEAAALVVIGIVTNLFYGHRRFEGQVFLLYLLLYAAVRAVTEAFRGDLRRGFFLPDLLGPVLSWSQGASVVTALVAVAILFYGAKRAAST